MNNITFFPFFVQKWNFDRNLLIWRVWHHQENCLFISLSQLSWTREVRGSLWSFYEFSVGFRGYHYRQSYGVSGCPTYSSQQVTQHRSQADILSYVLQPKTTKSCNICIIAQKDLGYWLQDNQIEIHMHIISFSLISFDVSNYIYLF